MKAILFRCLKIVLWIVASLFVLAAILFVYFNLPGPEPREDVRFGITFSSRFARDLGLDAPEVLRALFEDLGVQRVRIPVYWDTVERERGTFDFSDIDWQLDMARQYDVDVILAVGQKVPRWPECFVPTWADTDDLKNEAAVRFIRKTIEHYKDRSEISLWQIENEPFLAFGICPPLSGATLDREISAARAEDSSRPILTTDSGELSTWIPAASRGDVFGTTLYRKLWSNRFGYITYPIGPNFFRFKEMLVRIFSRQKNFMVIELQAEPWANGSFMDVSLDEQWKTMNAEQLLENVRYARQVGFSDVYLWGAEWWYWLREKRGVSDVWDAARDVFRAR
ncbi:MAG: hypothetical protein IPK84_01875 [Candidatus Moraniibacteriota bacterium]|nr:MAG: hypothetical protein IPK84_01875 [Candidatus Moranbacteria bacterium]